MAGDVRYGAAARVRDAVWAGGGEPARAVSALCDQCGDGIRAVASLAAGRRGGLGRPFAPAEAVARAHAGGDGSCGAAGARGAPGLGRSQDRPAAARSGARGGAEREHGHRDPAPARAARCGGQRRAGEAAAVRAGGAERVVADGLQGAFCARRRRALPSLDGSRRSFALRAGHPGLRLRRAQRRCAANWSRSSAATACRTAC